MPVLPVGNSNFFSCYKKKISFSRSKYCKQISLKDKELKFNRASCFKYWALRYRKKLKKARKQKWVKVETRDERCPRWEITRTGHATFESRTRRFYYRSAALWITARAVNPCPRYDGAPRKTLAFEGRKKGTPASERARARAAQRSGERSRMHGGRSAYSGSPVTSSRSSASGISAGYEAKAIRRLALAARDSIKYRRGKESSRVFTPPLEDVRCKK